MRLLVSAGRLDQGLESLPVTHGDAKFLELLGGERQGKFNGVDVVLQEDRMVFLQTVGRKPFQ